MRAIGESFSAAESQALIEAARGFLGVRFRHQGRSRGGVDCAGLVAMSLAAIGRPYADIPAYGREPVRQGLRGAIAANFGGPLVGRSSMRPGDVVLMRFREEPSHVGILGNYVYGGLSLIHSYARAKCVVEHRLDDEWSGYVTEVFRP